MFTLARFILLLGFLISMTSQASPWIWNDPYPESESQDNIYYASFSSAPKTLDPARSYSANEYVFIMQIYEPLFQYNYLLRPYQLEPLIAAGMPEIRYQNIGDRAYTSYLIKIKQGIRFQPHPSMAKDEQGRYRYLSLPPDYLDDEDISQLSDFKYSGTRELTVDDFIYQIKRLANPATNSPVYSLLSDHIVGFKDFARRLPNLKSNTWIDLRNYPLDGVKKIDDYTFEIQIHGQYAQFVFWLSMPFFAPIPWEADQFYSQAGMDDLNLGLENYPVGTGPFMLTKNNPHKRIILQKNPEFREVFYPSQGSIDDEKAGYLGKAGMRLPLIDQAIYTLEKESIPLWNKFMQGYYDICGISTESFDQAIQISSSGSATPSQTMKERKMNLVQTSDPSIYYMGFNMRDEVVGGDSERAKKLRQAISIAVNYDEDIAIFYNGRGLAAQGPIPPGIFGYREGQEGINPYVYRWDETGMKRRPLTDAMQLMREAGYPEGINPKTGQALILNYDVPASGGPDDKAQLDWMRKQFAKIGIDLNIRSTQYNRFQDKMRSGNAQIFSWGWNADYPDPENFLFLLYSRNGKVKYGGENAANYANPAFDRLFEKMKNMPDNAERQAIIDQMLAIVREDAPWVWGINSQSLVFTQQWVSAFKPNTITRNTLKYIAVDVAARNQFRALWNRAIIWPVFFIVLFFILVFIPIYFEYQRKRQGRAPRMQE